MKTIFLTLTTIIISLVQGESKGNGKRDIYASNSFDLTSHSGFNTYHSLSIPLQETQLYSLGLETFLPIDHGNIYEISKANIVPVAFSNSVEKPVQEPQEPPRQPITGTAVIPLRPPPAIPVNAAAANVPANNGAVFLGSGALGVVSLGNGIFALGSGGIGYSDRRQQPRPNGNAPLFPPLPATPNLIPAATPSQPPTIYPGNLAGPQLTTNGYQFYKPILVPNINSINKVGTGYEPINPNNVGFGAPRLIRRRPKTRMNYASPTLEQVQTEPVHPSQLPPPGFGNPLPRLPPHAVTYH